MRLIPIADLKISDNRQRREFEPKSLLELQESIEHLGLMHPVVVRNGNHFVAGERRLRAMKEIWALDNTFHCHNQLIPIGMVPCIDLGDLSPLEAMEAELDENIKRKDLTWQERSTAIARLHDFRVAQAAERGENHSIPDTAEELVGWRSAGPGNEIREQILVARHLADPDVAKAPNAKEAFKILKRKEEAEGHAALAVTVGATFGVGSHTLLLGDCISTMQTLDAASFDVILTDPPYGMGADEFGDSGGRVSLGVHGYDDSEEVFRGLILRAATEIARVAKPAAHLYVCCDIDQFHYLKHLFKTIGDWHVFRTPIIHYKRGAGRVPLPEHGPRRQYELVLYAYRGDRRVTAIYPDVIESSADDNLGHGAQKPVALYHDLLRRSARAGDRVLDPFCGTGTIYPAAHALKVAATGIELEPAYYGIAVKRIEGLA